MTMPATKTSQVGNQTLEASIRRETTATFRRTEYKALEDLFDKDVLTRACKDPRKPIELLVMVYEQFGKNPSELLADFNTTLQA